MSYKEICVFTETAYRKDQFCDFLEKHGYKPAGPHSRGHNTCNVMCVNIGTISKIPKIYHYFSAKTMTHDEYVEQLVRYATAFPAVNPTPFNIHSGLSFLELPEITFKQYAARKLVLDF